MSDLQRGWLRKQIKTTEAEIATWPEHWKNEMTNAKQAAEAVSNMASNAAAVICADELPDESELAAVTLIVKCAINAATAELVKERDRYREALKAIAAHQELIGGVTGARISAAHRIASEALELPTAKATP